MKLKRVTRAAMLTAIALTIFIIESQIPPLTPVPGIKMGLANIVTVFAMYVLGPADTFMILLVRILLGALFSLNPSSLIYSLSGGMSCYLFMLLTRRIFSGRQIWIMSIFGAVIHNIGQIAAAILVTGTKELYMYLPILTISGIIAGAFTGICAQLTADKLGGTDYFKN